jgi:hypothetical protein
MAAACNIRDEYDRVDASPRTQYTQDFGRTPRTVETTALLAISWRDNPALAGGSWPSDPQSLIV